MEKIHTSINNFYPRSTLGIILPVRRGFLRIIPPINIFQTEYPSTGDTVIEGSVLPIPPGEKGSLIPGM
jgi:hypothetical protein